MGKTSNDETTSAKSREDWHALEADVVLGRLQVDAKEGLKPDLTAQRLQEFGSNRLPEGKKQSAWMRFLLQFHNVLVYVLLAAGFIKLMVGLWLDAGIIFGVVILNSLLGFIQEGKAEKALDSIRNMLSAEARTLRGGCRPHDSIGGIGARRHRIA